MIDFTSPYVYIDGIVLLYIIIMILKLLIRTSDKRANDNIYKDYPSKGRKEKDNDVSIEISNDCYANDYDDISEKQTNKSVDDSDDDATETFGY